MSDSASLDRVQATISPGSTDSPKKTFHGSCHCGFIKYTVVIPQSQLETRTARRCNCTICLKQGMTCLGLPEADFTLISPTSLSKCQDYRIDANRDVHKYFCGTCGVHVVGAGKFPWKEQMIEFFQINLVTLDQPQEGMELSEWKIVYVDGRNDGFEKEWKDVPHPGGIV